MGEEIIKTLISVITSTFVSSLVTMKINKINRKNILLNELHNLMKYSMDYPLLENDYFTNQYNEISKFLDDYNSKEVYSYPVEIINRYNQYEIYCEMIFNYIEKICKYYKYEDKISDFLDIYGWIKRHKQYWFNDKNYKESLNGYGNKFVLYIDNIYKNK